MLNLLESLDQIYGVDDNSIDIDNFILDSMENDFVLLTTIMTNSYKLKNIRDLARRFIIKDSLVSDWFDKYTKIDMLRRTVVERIASDWLNDIKYYDIVFHPNDIHSILKVLRINLSKLWNEDEYDFKSESITTSMLIIMSDLDIPDDDKWKICEDIQYFFNSNAILYSSYFPFGVCYDGVNPPNPDQVKKAFHLMTDALFDDISSLMAERSDVRYKICEVCHMILNIWLNDMIKDNISGIINVYDTTDLLQLMHCVFQINRYRETAEISEVEWSEIYE